MKKNKPYLLVEWNDTETDAVGWLCIYNFVKNNSTGGIRMHPTVNAEEVIRLATTMGYKLNACESTSMGGCKGGIAYDYKAADAKDVLRRYVVAMSPYITHGASLGGDLGVSYDDVLEIFVNIGVGMLPQTHAMRADPAIQFGIKAHDDACRMKYDGFLMYDMITGYGVGAALDEVWQGIRGKDPKDCRVVIQGFGCAGASLASCLTKWGYKIVGIADANCFVSCDDGLDIKKLLATVKPKGEMDKAAFASNYLVRPNSAWLDIDCDVIVPAALEDVIHKDNVHKVTASLIVEAANIPITPEADKVLNEKGVDICVDFLTNLGGTRIYDAIIFNALSANPDSIANDTMDLIRKHTRKVFEMAAKTGKTTREIAREIFLPKKSDTPDLPKP